MSDRARAGPSPSDGGNACTAPGGLGEVTIDQLVSDNSGTVTALALQFGCLTSLGRALPSPGPLG